MPMTPREKAEAFIRLSPELWPEHNDHHYRTILRAHMFDGECIRCWINSLQEKGNIEKWSLASVELCPVARSEAELTWKGEVCIIRCKRWPELSVREYRRIPPLPTVRFKPDPNTFYRVIQDEDRWFFEILEQPGFPAPPRL